LRLPNKRLQLTAARFGRRPFAHGRRPLVGCLTRERPPDDTAWHTGRLQLSRDPLGGTVVKRARPKTLTLLAGVSTLAGVAGAVQAVDFLLGTPDLSAIPVPEERVRSFIEAIRPLAFPNLLAAIWLASAGVGLLFLHEWARRLMEWFWLSWALLLLGFVFAASRHSAGGGPSLLIGLVIASPLLALAALIIHYLRSERIRAACAA
jgi:hypothetical protein